MTVPTAIRNAAQLRPINSRFITEVSPCWSVDERDRSYANFRVGDDSHNRYLRLCIKSNCYENVKAAADSLEPCFLRLCHRGPQLGLYKLRLSAKRGIRPPSGQSSRAVRWQKQWFARVAWLSDKRSNAQSERR